jgi:hypothetical protein
VLVFVVLMMLMRGAGDAGIERDGIAQIRHAHTPHIAGGAGETALLPSSRQKNEQHERSGQPSGAES